MSEENFGYIVTDQNGTTLVANLTQFKEMGENPYQIVGNLLFSLKTLFEVNFNTKISRFELNCCQITFLPHKDIIVFVLAQSENREINLAKAGLLLRSLSLATEKYLMNLSEPIYNTDVGELREILDQEMFETLNDLKCLMGSKEIATLAHKIRNHLDAQEVVRQFKLPPKLLNNLLELGGDEHFRPTAPIISEIPSEQELIDALEQEEYSLFSFPIQVYRNIQHPLIRIAVLEAWLQIQSLEPAFYIPSFREITNEIDSLPDILEKKLLRAKARRFLHSGTSQELLLVTLESFKDIKAVFEQKENLLRKRVLSIILSDVGDIFVQRLIRKHFKSQNLINWWYKTTYIISLINAVVFRKKDRNLVSQYEASKALFRKLKSNFPLIALRFIKLVFYYGFSLLGDPSFSLQDGKQIIFELYDFGNKEVSEIESTFSVMSPKHLGQIDTFSITMLLPLYLDLVNLDSRQKKDILETHNQKIINHMSYMARLRKLGRIEQDYYEIILSSLISSLSDVLARQDYACPTLASVIAHFAREIIFESSVALPLYHWSILYIEMLFTLLNLASLIRKGKKRAMIIETISNSILEFISSKKISRYDIIYYNALYRLARIYSKYSVTTEIDQSRQAKQAPHFQSFLNELPPFWKDAFETLLGSQS